METPTNNVWKNFKRLDSHFAQCKFCWVRISILRRAEENLIRHLEKRHSGKDSVMSVENEKEYDVYVIDDESEPEQDVEEAILPNLILQTDLCVDSSDPENNSNDASSVGNGPGATPNPDFNVIVKVSNGETTENIEIWKHFIQLNNGSALCGHCSKMFSTKKKDFLTKLVVHLKEKHPGDSTAVIMTAIEKYKKINSHLTSADDVQLTISRPVKKKRDSKSSSAEPVPTIPEQFLNHYEYWKNHAKCNYCGALISLNQAESIKRIDEHLKIKHKITAIAIYKSNETISRPASTSLLTPTELAHEPPPLKIAKVVSEYDMPKLVPIRSPKIPTLPTPIVSNLSGRAMDEMILKMVVKGYHNCSIIDEAGFQSFIKASDPLYILPASTEFSNELLIAYYEKIRSTLVPKLLNTAAVTLSMEEFKLHDQRNFIEFKAHFIDDKCQLSSKTLNCFEFDPNESGDAIYNCMITMLNEWNISEKLVTIVSNTTPTALKITQRNKRSHLPCFYGVIDKIVHSSFDEITCILDTVRQVVNHFRENEVASIDLLLAQKKMSPQPRPLIHDEPGHWISTYDMLSRLLENKNTLQIYHSKFFMPELIASEWILLDHICNILRIFKSVLTEMATEKFSTVSKVVFYMDSIKHYISQYTTSQITFLPVEIAQITQFILKEMEAYKITFLHVEATLLDPRLKKQAFREDQHFQLAYKSVCKIANSIVLPEDNEIVTLPSDIDSIWYEWDIQYATEISISRQNKQKGKDELNRYLQEPLVERKVDPLQWWSQRKVLYPRLYQIVLNRLCIIASSVACDRLFAASEREAIEQRKMLVEKHVSKIVFINGNLE